jgi:hypothetical protein
MIGQWKASDQGGQGICLKIGYHGCPFFQKPENCKEAYISTLPYYNQYYQKMKIFTSIISIKMCFQAKDLHPNGKAAATDPAKG